MRNWVQSLQRRIGRRVYEAAARDAARGQLDGAGLNLQVARVLAVIVLASPLLAVVAAAGMVLIGGLYPAPIAFAAVLLAVAWFLWPKRDRPEKALKRRADLPATFALVDALTQVMKSPAVDAIEIYSDFNAHVRTLRGERVLGIGALLWQCLTPDQRLAVLAHEIGHLVSGDPNRTGPVWRAQVLLERWRYLITPSQNEALSAAALLLPLTLMVELLQVLIGRLSFLASQRAEYRADALATGLAGKAAMRSLLETLSFDRLITLQRRRLHMPSMAPDRSVIDGLAAGVTEASPEARRELLDKMRAESWLVDQSHPPTVHRIAFVDGLNAPVLPSFDQSPYQAALDHEWEEILNEQGRVLHGQSSRQ